VKNKIDRVCSTYRGKGEAYTGFWWENLREGDHLGGLRRRWEDNIKIDLQKVGCGEHGLDRAGLG